MFLGVRSGEAHGTESIQRTNTGYSSDSTAGHPAKHPQEGKVVTGPETCPMCGDLIAGVVTNGPDDHRAQPCGHRLPPGHQRLTNDTEDESSNLHDE